MNDNELTHHGIKGMRWGVRRTEKQLARARGESTVKKHASSTSTKTSSTSTSAKGSAKKETDNDAEEQISTKALKDRNERLRLEKEYKSMLMSDDDLKQRVDRLKLEREYQQLTKKEKSKGRQLVEDVLSTAAKTVATKFVTDALSKMVGNVLSKNGSNESAGKAGEAFAEAAKQFTKQATDSAKSGTTSSRKSSSSSKTTFDSSDFDVSGEGTSRGSTKSKDNDFVYADFQDISYNAGRSYFDTTFALAAPSTPALSAPKDDKD